MNIHSGPGNMPTPHDCRAIQAQCDALRNELAYANEQKHALRDALLEMRAAVFHLLECRTARSEYDMREAIKLAGAALATKDAP